MAAALITAFTASLMTTALLKPTTFMPGSPATFNISMFAWIKQFNQFFAFGILIP